MAEASNEQSTDGQIFNEKMTNGIHGRGYGARAAHANRVQRVVGRLFPLGCQQCKGKGKGNLSLVKYSA